MTDAWAHILVTTWRIWPPLTPTEARRAAMHIITYRALMKLTDAVWTGAIDVEEYAHRASVLLRQLDSVD